MQQKKSHNATAEEKEKMHMQIIKRVQDKKQEKKKPQKTTKEKKLAKLEKKKGR